MAYDPVKAHEYYMKYKKKGLKKGRKKGKGKTASTRQTSLVGLSTGGLNDAGKMNWAMTKKDLQAEMNAELAKATTDEQKAEIRADYQGRALQELQKMKKDPAFAQAKKAKAGKAGSSKAGSSKSGSKSSGSNGKTKKEKKAKTIKPKTSSKKIVLSSVPKTSTGGSKASSTSKAKTEEQKAQRQALFDQANSLIQEVSAKFKDMTPQEKTKAKKTLKDAVSKLRAIANKI